MADPNAARAKVTRLVRSVRRTIPCKGGHDYFYIEWKLGIWRRAAWAEPDRSVFDTDRVPDIREPCNNRTMRRPCERPDADAIAVIVSVQGLRKYDVAASIRALACRGTVFSLWSLLRDELPGPVAMAR